MRKYPLLTRRQIATAARIAREHGVSVKLDPNGSVIVSPDAQADSSGAPSDAELDRELELFEAKHGDGKASWRT
jgi:hypothetical protein